MKETITCFVGLDAHKDSIAIAVPEASAIKDAHERLERITEALRLQSSQWRAPVGPSADVFAGL